MFLNQVFKFLGVGFALYGVVRTYIFFTKDETIIKHEKKCQYCRKSVSLKVLYEQKQKAKAKFLIMENVKQAIRCPTCTSWLDGREEF